MLGNIFKTTTKIPTSRKLGNHFQASGANTILALVGHALQKFRVDENSVNTIIFTWLEELNFTIKFWNEARSEIGLVSPRSRTKIDSAMKDIVANYDFNKIYIIHPDDYSLVPGLSSTVMALNLTDSSKAKAKNLAPASKTASKKPSFSNVLKTTLKQKSGPVKGSSHLKIGVAPVDLFLHLKIAKGGNIEPIQKLLESKKSVSQVKVTKLTETNNFSTFQLLLKINMVDLDFWKKDAFWPSGTVVNRWKGSTQTERESFSKRILISGIKGGTTTSTIENYFRQIYPSINFVEMSCDKIVGAKAVLSVKLDSRNFKNFMATGLSNNQWPGGVGVKFLNKGSTESRNSSWELEVVREEHGEVTILEQTTEDLTLPVEEKSSEELEAKQIETIYTGPKFGESSSETIYTGPKFGESRPKTIYTGPKFGETRTEKKEDGNKNQIDKDHMDHMLHAFTQCMSNSKFHPWFWDFDEKTEDQNYEFLCALDSYFYDRKAYFDGDENEEKYENLYNFG